jgi:hypothetical protein
MVLEANKCREEAGSSGELFPAQSTSSSASRESGHTTSAAAPQDSQFDFAGSWRESIDDATGNYPHFHGALTGDKTWENPLTHTAL